MGVASLIEGTYVCNISNEHQQGFLFVLIHRWSKYRSGGRPQSYDCWRFPSWLHTFCNVGVRYFCIPNQVITYAMIRPEGECYTTLGCPCLTPDFLFKWKFLSTSTYNPTAFYQRLLIVSDVARRPRRHAAPVRGLRHSKRSKAMRNLQHI